MHISSEKYRSYRSHQPQLVQEGNTLGATKHLHVFSVRCLQAGIVVTMTCSDQRTQTHEPESNALTRYVSTIEHSKVTSLAPRRCQYYSSIIRVTTMSCHLHIVVHVCPPAKTLAVWSHLVDQNPNRLLQASLVKQAPAHTPAGTCSTARLGNTRGSTTVATATSLTA